jgi:rfaE bifunctional protein kinase chain/domain
MSETEIRSLFEKFNELKVLVIGDVMIDAYVWGKVERISPEAPVPVVRVTAKEDRLGGAANVALNIAALGSEPVVCAIAGVDQKGEVLGELLSEKGMSAEGIVYSDERPTTVKTRVISNHQHIVRVDEESNALLSAKEEAAMLARVESLMDSQRPDVVIFEDYNKGLLTAHLIEASVKAASIRGIPTAVDPKKENFFIYRGVTLFKPNFKELMEGLKLEIAKGDQGGLEAAVAEMEALLKNEISLITLSEQGVFIKAGEARHHLPAHIRKIADVSGAGDTVISVAALCLALKAPLEFMAALSNLAGGLVCEKVGVVPIDKSRLESEALRHLATG